MLAYDRSGQSRRFAPARATAASRSIAKSRPREADANTLFPAGAKPILRYKMLVQNLRRGWPEQVRPLTKAMTPSAHQPNPGFDIGRGLCFNS
jgi:hypothetical protein